MRNLTDADLDAIKARADAATPGPWLRGIHTGEFELLDGHGNWLGGVEDFDDVEFIIHAREDIEKLLEALKLANKRVMELEAQ